MPSSKKAAVKGWVPAKAQPKRADSQAADVKSASLSQLKQKIGADAAKAPRGARKLRGVYLRPTKGSDSDAKLFIVDQSNHPKIAQG